MELTNLKWKFKTGGDIDSLFTTKITYKGIVSKYGKKQNKNVYSSPAVADGIVFFGSTDNYLYAVDIKTGREKWKFKTENRVLSSPAVADGVVFFGSTDNYFYALE